ncbi:MAG: DUF433 domain-containing protein [Chloroflexi bacterium]|nr:DUF433 domain-containing protein [Chloroflexota bacterium]
MRRTREQTVAYQTKGIRRSHPYVVRGKVEPMVRGSDVTVRAIVAAWRSGSSLDALARQFAPLRLAEICDALGYYDDHRDELGESFGAPLSLGQDPEKIRQREMNHRAFVEMAANLQAKYPNQWVCIAFGKLQAVGDDWTQVAQVAGEAKHRIVTQIRNTTRAPRRLPFRYRVGRFIR